MRERRDEKAQGFGRRLREARERRGFSQEELAGRAGVSRSVVAFAELGTRVPHPRNRIKLSEALGVDLGELWDGGASDEGARDLGRP